MKGFIIFQNQTSQLLYAKNYNYKPFTLTQIPLDEDRGRGPHSTGGSSQGKSGKVGGTGQ